MLSLVLIDYLDSHNPPEAFVVGKVDFRHPTLQQTLFEAIAIEAESAFF